MCQKCEQAKAAKAAKEAGGCGCDGAEGKAVTSISLPSSSASTFDVGTGELVARVGALPPVPQAPKSSGSALAGGMLLGVVLSMLVLLCGRWLVHRPNKAV